MLSLFGSGIGRGLAIGQAYVLRSSEVDAPEIAVPAEQIADEVKRFKRAVAVTLKKYRLILRELPADAPKESAAFINAHMMMLRDPLLVDESIKIIEKDLVNAEHALRIQSDNLIKVFENMDDAYLRNKKEDVQHVTNRLLRNLLGIVVHSLEDTSEEDLSGRIVVSDDLSPAEAMLLNERKVAAFVTDVGSTISHTAIVARSMRMPAVVGLHGCRRYINDDDLLIVDGKRGIIVVNPGEAVLREYRATQRRLRKRELELDTLIKRYSKTRDGVRIQLYANIETANELKEVKRVNAAGIGLYRTEYLFMNRDQAPSEQEQFAAYKRIVSAVGKPVVIRTLDIGGDKRLDFNYPQKSSSESPLGLRAVRLCLNNMDLFKPQLRAIFRASAYGKVSIMIPMVSNYDEVNQVFGVIKQTKSELKKEGVA
ncbi:MAG: phosphoenolpyruvate--protein phosphotransferase, partial [Arenicella sp.]|nr:phosphoenolpyruvate--protein phosphotransferase [Arenicella sp.]